MGKIVLAAGVAITGRSLIWLAILVAGASACADSSDRAPVVAAAASVRFALEELAETFYLDTDQRVRLSLGSSGNLARQIRQGAPYDVFLAADPRYVEDLAGAGLTRDSGKNYLIGRLAIVVPLASPLAADGSLEDLRAALSEGRVKRFAIANPEHAPYGQRAEQALRHSKLWDEIRERLVLGENVGQAAQFAFSGNTQGGIIGFGLARAPAFAERGTAALIPGDWHAPLHHRAVLLNAAGPVAQQFFDYLSSPAARDVFRKHGFDVPGDSG